jgi:protocatechuate 3,4-dioxygenase, alpha subunit
MTANILKETPSQTGGPYIHIGTLPAFAGLKTRSQQQLHILGTTDQLIRIEGTIFDGASTPVADGIIELWQADPSGRYNAPGFQGWGRAPTGGPEGVWHFETVKPGTVPWRDGRPQAPHVTLAIFARGINIHLHTRMYFPEDEAALAADPVLLAIEHPARRRTLVATRLPGEGVPVYRFDIQLQGERETVFFDI